MSIINKPKLIAEDQVIHLAQKGVKFSTISQKDALEYLIINSNYFKLTSYRKNFEKHITGPDAGKYLDLEFALLKDLAIIDMRLRYTLIHMALDIEHFSKVQLLRKIELALNEDGYSLVTDFIASLEARQKSYLESEISRNKKSPYCRAIISKYDGSYPIWAFVEIIPFGRLLSLYLFCADRFDDKSLRDQHYLLLGVVQLRNAVAHNNCIINDLSPNTTEHDTRNAVNIALGEIKGISKTTRQRKMSNVRVQQIVTLLFVHKVLVTSEGVHKNRAESLHRLTERMFKNLDTYHNDRITTTFVFLKNIIDSWFPVI